MYQENADRARLPVLSARSHAHPRLGRVATRCTVVALLTFPALGSFAKSPGRPIPAPAPIPLMGELSDLNITLGTAERVCIHAFYTNGTEGLACNGLDWHLTNPDPANPVGSVDATGMVAGLSVGQAALSVTYAGRTLSARCTVTEPVLKRLIVAQDHPTIDAGNKESFGVTAEFENGPMKQVVHGVRWTVADVAPATQVAVIDQTGQAKGIHPGMAEIRASWLGQTASTMLSVVPPSQAAPAPVRTPGLRPKTWRQLCMTRLRHVWLPRLRALPGAKAELTSSGDRSYGVVTVIVHQAALEREIAIRWNPEECDAAGPTSGWSPSGFDWQSPATELEHTLAAAGYDCGKYIP